jgi:hypothetical protein
MQQSITTSKESISLLGSGQVGVSPSHEAVSGSLFTQPLPFWNLVDVIAGSTVPYAVERILQQGDVVNQKRWFIPTGFQSKELIVKAGLRLGDVDVFPDIDVTVDGADE